MSKNNTIRKSDKKFIRSEKARIRRQILDVKKQEEMIDNLYKKFIKPQKSAEVNAETRGSEKTETPKVEVKKDAKKSETRKEKVVKKSKTK